MRNALDDFLLKENFYNKEVLNLILETIRESSEYYEKRSNVESLILRFSKKMTEKAIYSVFKNLWSISFKSEDQPCVDNRRPNSLACVFLFREIKKRPSVLGKVWDDIESFEHISKNHQTISFLFLFFCEHPEFHKKLSAEFKELIRYIYDKEVDYKNDYPYNLKIASTFLFSSPKDYLEYLIDGYEKKTINYLTENVIKFITNIYGDFDCNEYLNKMIVNYVLNSTSYDDADKRFDFLFKSEVFNRLDISSLEYIVDSWSRYSQVSGRIWRSKPDLEKIKKRILEIS